MAPSTLTPAGSGSLASVAWAVLRRPELWGVAVRQLFRLAGRGWWRRWPPVPSPDRSYLAFRLQTAYGDPSRPPEPVDVVAYLEWCRRFPGLTPPLYRAARALRYPRRP